jgi:hypothetical protein
LGTYTARHDGVSATGQMYLPFGLRLADQTPSPIPQDNAEQGWLYFVELHGFF